MDDKIIARAQENGEDPSQLATRSVASQNGMVHWCRGKSLDIHAVEENAHVTVLRRLAGDFYSSEIRLDSILKHSSRRASSG